jgi:hypothetical protein
MEKQLIAKFKDIQGRGKGVAPSANALKRAFQLAE